MVVAAAGPGLQYDMQNTSLVWLLRAAAPLPRGPRGPTFTPTLAAPVVQLDGEEEDEDEEDAGGNGEDFLLTDDGNDLDLRWGGSLCVCLCGWGGVGW